MAHYGHQCACVKYTKMIIREGIFKHKIKQNPFSHLPNCHDYGRDERHNDAHPKNAPKQDNLKGHF